MRSDFQFSNLLGTVYRNANLQYTKDGKTLLSPVGNRVSVFDLVNNTSFTFDYQHRKNIQRIALNPQNTLLLSVDTDGRGILVNFKTRSVLHHFNFQTKFIGDIKFSPNGGYFAITTGRFLQIWKIMAGGVNLVEFQEDEKEMMNYNDRQFAPFVKFRKLAGHYNDITSVSWSKDSKYLLTTSKDMTTRIWSLFKKDQKVKMSLAGHRDYVINAFFNSTQDIIYTLSKDGALLQWEYTKKPKDTGDSESEEEAEEEEEEEEEEVDLTQMSFRITKKNYFLAPDYATVKSSAFNPATNMLIVGFSNGEFRLYELPSFILIQQLSMGQNAINTVEVNNTGEWLAFGAAKLGQLLVYEWQSESYILKQQGHFDSMNSLCYSSDGSRIITGSDDGKIKIWDLRSGFCLATLSEHSSAVTSIVMTEKNSVLFSSSLDGTIRAWDLIRYRNFRTYTAPNERIQFNNVAIDPSGEVVVASSLNSFEIFVWSVQSGQLLDSLTGHEGPISHIAFGKESSVLVSASWDKTIRVWDIFGRNLHVEPFELYNDALAIAVRPDSKQVAVSTLDGQISLWDIENGKQVGNIDCKKDIFVGRYFNDSFTAKNSKRSRFFTTIDYSFDGNALICGGKNNSICLYDLNNEVLLKKFTVSENINLDGTLTKLNSKKLTEDGVNLELIDTAGENSDLEDRIDKSLPGSQRGDPTLRNVRPEIRINSIKFSPTANEFSAAATEGLLIYAIDSKLIFDPFDLDINITPEAILHELKEKNHLIALVMSFRLNENDLINQVFESTPIKDIRLLLEEFPVVYLSRLLKFMGELSIETNHWEFILIWLKQIFDIFGRKILENKMQYGNSLNLIQRFLNRISKDLVNVSKNNVYLYSFLNDSSKIEDEEAQSADDVLVNDVLVEVKEDNEMLDDDDNEGDEDEKDDDNEWLGGDNVPTKNGLQSFGDDNDDVEED